MMTTLNQFYFTNKSCKCNDHDHCDGIWRGLGIQVCCDCKCHVDAGNYLLSPPTQEADDEEGAGEA